jgi:hypothetical protein
MAAREAEATDFIQNHLSREKIKALHAYISYYDMFKDAHKVKEKVTGSGEDFMRLAAEQILMQSGAPRRDHRDLSAFMKSLNKTSFGQQTAKICRLEHLDGQGNDITERNKLPPFIKSCFQDAFKDPLSIREDLQIFIGLAQYLDPASRNIDGEIVGFGANGNSVSYTQEQLQAIGIWGVQSISGRSLPNNECDATIIIDYTGMSIAAVSLGSAAAANPNQEIIKCRFTKNFKPITPETKDYFLGNATKNRWFNANADRRTGASAQVKRELYRTGIKFLLCKEIGDTFQVLFHSLYTQAGNSSPEVAAAALPIEAQRNISICMLTCDNVVSSRSRLENNTVLARSGNAENDEEDEEKDKFGEYILYYRGDPAVERRGLIDMFCNNSIRNNHKVIAIINKVIDEGFLEIQGIRIDLSETKNRFVGLFLEHLLSAITIQNTEISTTRLGLREDQSPEEVRKLCIEKEAIMMFKQQRDKITCIYTLENLLPGRLSYAELLEGFFTYLAGQPQYSEVRGQLQRRAATAEIAASRVKKPQLGSILSSLLSNVPLLTTRDRPTRSRRLEPVTVLPLNIAIPAPLINIPGSANATAGSQRGGLYKLEQEDLRVADYDSSFTMRDNPNEMYRYTVDCLFLELNNEITSSKVRAHSFSPDILFHFFNLMYYYFNYVGEICAERGILKACILMFLNGRFSTLTLQEFEAWYLQSKNNFLYNGQLEDIPDLNFFLDRSSSRNRVINDDEELEELATSPSLKPRANSFFGEYNTSRTGSAASNASSASKKRRTRPLGNSNTEAVTQGPPPLVTQGQGPPPLVTQGQGPPPLVRIRIPQTRRKGAPSPSLLAAQMARRVTTQAYRPSNQDTVLEEYEGSDEERQHRAKPAQAQPPGAQAQPPGAQPLTQQPAFGTAKSAFLTTPPRQTRGGKTRKNRRKSRKGNV